MKVFQFSYQIGGGVKIYPVSKYTQVPDCQYEVSAINYIATPAITLDVNDQRILINMNDTRYNDTRVHLTLEVEIGGVFNSETYITIDFYMVATEEDVVFQGENTPPYIQGTVLDPPPIPCLNLETEVANWKYDFAKVKDLENHMLTYSLECAVIQDIFKISNVGNELSFALNSYV